MTDVVVNARNARECLARGLGALQSPGVPDHLMSVAEPIARAMSNLHRIESSQGQALAEAGQSALDAVRSALSMLQTAQVAHPAVESAMEAVAGSLGLVHGLSQAAAAPRQPAAFPQAQAQAPVYAQAPAQSPAPVYTPAPAQSPAPVYAQAPAQSPAPVYAQAPAQSPAPVYAQAPVAAAVQPKPAASAPAVLADTVKSDAPAPIAKQPGFAESPTLQSPDRRDLGVGAAALAQPTAGAADAGSPRVEASLGAHSPTNFYKGLSGNDVVDAGGIFVATYQIPAIGKTVTLHVSLPGGYEFQAQAVVRWTREPAGVSDGSSPGFGAQFTQITPEGRQLVHRYVRNREPLFHDDL